VKQKNEKALFQPWSGGRISLRNLAYNDKLLQPYNLQAHCCEGANVYSVTLTRNIWATWRWSEWWSKYVGAFI